jgi:HEAT repeat protein
MLWWKKLRLTVGGPEARLQAIEQLANSGDPAGIDVLIEALQDRDGQVPVRAAEALGRLRVFRAVPALMTALKDKEEYIRWAAADALAQIGEKAVEPLVGLLRDPNPTTRDVAIRTLGKIGPAAVPGLSSALKNPMKAMRETAADALGGIHHERAVPPLLEALADKELTVRERAARALVGVGTPAVASLFKALNHDNAEVKKRAAWALEQLGQEPMTETYIRPIAHGKWKDTNVAAPALDTVAATLKDPSKEKRFIAVRTLANVGDDRAVPGLIEALADSDREIRDMAIHALVKIRAAAVQPLLAALKEGDAALRPKAAAVLGYIGDPRSRMPLMAALGDPEPAVRANAAEALAAYRKDKRLVEPLVFVLKDPDVRVRFNAAGSLWKIGDPSATPALLELLDDPDTATRKRAAQVLGNIGDARIVEPLLKLFLNDKEVRLEAALAVAKVKPARAVKPLATVVADDDHAAEEAIEILVDVLNTAAKDIAPDDLRALAELPKALASAAGPKGGMVRNRADATKVAGLAADELVRRGLMDRPGATAAVRGTAESRLSVRKPANSVEVFILHAMHQLSPESGHVVDKSDGGLGLTTRRAYDAGAMLSLRPASAGDEVPWVLLEVRHCRPEGKNFRVGCKFVRSPSYGVFVLFG